MPVTATPPTRVADGVTRLGTSLVNWYLVEEEGRLTVVDAGLPAYRPQLDVALRTLGRRLHEVEAIVLTHAHADHVGLAEMLRRETGAPVSVHEGDREVATSPKLFGKTDGTMLPYLRYAGTYRLLGHLARGGGMRPRPIREVRTFADGDVLDVPGRPRVLHTPGHTAGHSSLLLEDRGVLLAGDALCTLHPLTGRTGPQLLPSAFNLDSGRALRSLARLEEGSARVVLPGHGEPWTAGAASAVERARVVGIT